MTKQVQKTSSKKLKLYIINSVHNYNKLPEDVSKSKCNYHLKPFVKDGLVRRKGYGVWELTPKGKRLFDSKQLQLLSLDTSVVIGGLKKSKKKIVRGHGFMWKLKLPSKAHYDLATRKKLLKRYGKEYTELHNKTLSISLRGHKVHLASRTIVVYFDSDISFYGKSALDSYKEALLEFNKLISVIERIYLKQLRIRGLFKFKVCKNHYGDLNNEFAIHYKNKGKFLRVYDNGKEWLVMDFSDKKFIEAETTASDRAKYDMDSVITPTMNTLRADPDLLNRLKKENEELKIMFSDTQKMLRIMADKLNGENNIERFKY